jgi:hypothetical protein
MNTAIITWVAVDPASLHVLELAEKLADTSTTLLITGESGTGKDQLARWIHERGPRRDAPFLKIDCASLPAELVESELFGHERGAFTGAVARKPGGWRWLRAEQSCSMKSQRSPPECRQSCCASSKSGHLKGWAAPKCSAWTGG